jgi:hypothetical protein
VPLGHCSHRRTVKSIVARPGPQAVQLVDAPRLSCPTGHSPQLSFDDDCAAAQSVDRSR